MKHWQTMTTTLLLMLGASLQAGEPGTIIKSSELKSKPFADASSSGTVEASTRIDIISRQGAWMQVKPAKGSSGWVRMLNVRTDAASQAADSSIDKLGKLYKTGSSGSAVTTGVKGLSAEELQQAHPNQAELQKMNNYRSNNNDARQFAQQGRLSNQHIDYLP